MDEGGSVDSLEDENSKADTSVMLPAQLFEIRNLLQTGLRVFKK